MAACGKRVLELHAAGELVALVDDSMRLDDDSGDFVGLERVSDAVAHMLSGTTIGKVVVKIGEEK